MGHHDVDQVLARLRLPIAALLGAHRRAEQVGQLGVAVRPSPIEVHQVCFLAGHHGSSGPSGAFRRQSLHHHSDLRTDRPSVGTAAMALSTSEPLSDEMRPWPSQRLPSTEARCRAKNPLTSRK
jgi:hypothetical protein